MTELIDSVEGLFDSLGLMTGEYAIPKRALMGTLAGGLLVTYIQPALMFDENGNPRPWILFGDDSGEATYIPWWFASIAGAFAFGVLI